MIVILLASEFGCAKRIVKSFGGDEFAPFREAQPKVSLQGYLAHKKMATHLGPS